MRIVGGKRGSGKTTELIKLSAKTGDYIVTRSYKSAHYTAMLAKALELDIPYPITYVEFLSGQWSKGSGVKGFLIDDAEELLLQLIPLEKPIHAMSVSIGDVYEVDDERVLRGE